MIVQVIIDIKERKEIRTLTTGVPQGTRPDIARLIAKGMLFAAGHSADDDYRIIFGEKTLENQPSGFVPDFTYGACEY